jgi:hypothetical protein
MVGSIKIRPFYLITKTVSISRVFLPGPENLRLLVKSEWAKRNLMAAVRSLIIVSYEWALFFIFKTGCGRERKWERKREWVREWVKLWWFFLYVHHFATAILCIRSRFTDINMKKMFSLSLSAARLLLFSHTVRCNYCERINFHFIF